MEVEIDFVTEITRHFFKAFVTIFTFILVVAGFYMNIERMNFLFSSFILCVFFFLINYFAGNTLVVTADPKLPPLQFHETVYFLVVTLTTVG